MKWLKIAALFVGPFVVGYAFFGKFWWLFVAACYLVVLAMWRKSVKGGK